ncbi:MAG: lysoplasmalogenase [Deltaproteobacteria bacterium]|nr:lysoplasmalogenase [Deltaproteobacteria bacterium]
MPLLWSLAAGASAFYLALVGAGRKHPVKVAPALLLAGATFSASPLASAGLAFCALGDGLLLDKDRRFLHGLGAFLVGHLLLIGAFATAGRHYLSTAVLGALGGGLLLVIALVLAVLWKRLQGVLRLAVPVYAATLGAMVVAAGTHSAMALAGALVFVVSDSVLAINHFARRFRGAEMMVMVTYYSAILAIAGSFLQFS